jgi:ribosomal protein S30
MKTKGGAVKKIAKKLLPKLKKKELDRLRKAKENKGNE